MKHCVIIGGGAAGCFAAINASRKFPNNRYTILEATNRPLSKVLISGGGRCNVTHNCFEPAQLVKNYPRGSKELIGPMHRFGPEDIQKWFADEGVSLVAEKDGRMFPATNTSKTIINCFLNALEREKVDLLSRTKVRDIEIRNGIFEINLQEKPSLKADYLLIATGSSPLGYKIIENLGHSLSTPVPSLFTFKISDSFLHNLMGLSVEDAHIKLVVTDNKKKRSWQQKGAVLITHWGLSGPAVLKLSAFAARDLNAVKYQAKIYLNWLGDTKTQDCFDQIWSFRAANLNKKCTHFFPFSSLPKRLWSRFIADDEERIWNSISKKEVHSMAQKLTNHELKTEGKSTFKKEFVTCGGVKREEIDFTTMQSKLIPNLFFSGEVIDIDGVTGGFNFQNAWTGSWIASHYFGE